MRIISKAELPKSQQYYYFLSLSSLSLHFFFQGGDPVLGNFTLLIFLIDFPVGSPTFKQVSDGISFALQSCKFYRERILHAISPKQEMDTQRTCHITSHWGGRGQLLLFYIPIFYLTQLQSTLSF